jgi:hypothetical protein
MLMPFSVSINSSTHEVSSLVKILTSGELIQMDWLDDVTGETMKTYIKCTLLDSIKEESKGIPVMIHDDNIGGLNSLALASLKELLTNAGIDCWIHSSEDNEDRVKVRIFPFE